MASLGIWSRSAKRARALPFDTPRAVISAACSEPVAVKRPSAATRARKVSSSSGRAVTQSNFSVVKCASCRMSAQLPSIRRLWKRYM